MKRLHKLLLPAFLLLVGIMALSTLAYPSSVSAQDDTTLTDEPKQCLVTATGLRDCSNIFIERGEPTGGGRPPACSGYGCDGLYAYTHGCTTNYGVVASRIIYNGAQRVGYVQLWWSNDCQTNWTRTVREVALPGTSWAYIYRDNDRSFTLDVPPDTAFHASGSGTDIRTGMVYAPWIHPMRPVMSCGSINGAWGDCTPWW